MGPFQNLSSECNFYNDRKINQYTLVLKLNYNIDSKRPHKSEEIEIFQKVKINQIFRFF